MVELRGQTERGSNPRPSPSLLSCGLELITSPFSASVSSSINGTDRANFGGCWEALEIQRGCRLPPKCGMPPLSLGESCFVREAERGQAGSGCARGLKPQAENTAPGESLLPLGQAIPAGVFFPSVQNRNVLKMQGLQSAPGQGCFSTVRLNLVLKGCAWWQGLRPFAKGERGLVSRQQEPDPSSAFGTRSACELTPLEAGNRTGSPFHGPPGTRRFCIRANATKPRTRSLPQQVTDSVPTKGQALFQA